jgi:alcohol dehydrogenase
MTACIDGLNHNGELVVLGADAAPIQVSPFQIIAGSKKVYGHPSGTARDVEETLRFAALTGVRAMTEEVPLAEIESGYQRMLSGDARYRVVLTTGK